MSNERQPQKRQKARVPATKPAGEATSQKLVGRLAAKYGVPATSLLGTLRDTVFATGDNKPFSDTELAAALILSEKYNLNPFAREIYMTRNRGKLLVIVPVDGWSKIVNAQPDYDGCEFEYTDDEDGNPISCTCTIHDKRRGHPVAITEYYDECHRDTGPWNQWPRRMLRHKAFIQAARIAYGLGGVMDDDEAERIREPEYKVIEPTPLEPRRQPATLVATEPAPDPEQKAEPAPEPVAELKPERTPRDDAWDEWQSYKHRLSKDQMKTCAKEAGTSFVDKACSLEQLDVAIAMAKTLI